MIVTLVMVVLMGVGAILVDLAQVRSSRRIDQSVADLAALAAARKLGLSDPVGGCGDAIRYLNTNVAFSNPIDPAGFCLQAGNSMASTVCSTGGELPQATPSTTVGRYTVSIHYPVTDGEIQDPRFAGPGVLDGAPCQRMRVVVTTRDELLFGKIFGSSPLVTSRSATVKPDPRKRGLVPALWLLDPTGCTALSVGGGSQLTLGSSEVPGVLSVDSDGSTCNSNQVTLSVTGSGTKLTAVPTDTAAIQLNALPDAATACSAPACDPADVTAGRLSPQPVKLPERATRALIDWIYNCKASYPSYHGIPITRCPDAGTVPPYVDRLRAAVGTSGAPNASYQRWTDTYSCNPSGTITVSGNWWVDCSTLKIGSGTAVSFDGGNVVFDGGLQMTGGSLSTNGANPTEHLPPACVPPAVSTPCLTESSEEASIVYVRSGNWVVTGGQLAVNEGFLYLHSGYIRVAGGAPPTLIGPTEGPFSGLGLWAEASSSQYNINGGAGVKLSGAFFTPEATPFSLGGGGNWGQQAAQFITYQMAVSGGGVITMAPNPTSGVKAPIRAGVLIR